MRAHALNVKPAHCNLGFRPQAASSVELELMVGENGEGITLHNVPIKGFPSPAMQDHRQFRSKRLKHEDEKNGFDYEGTNGMTTHLIASSKTAKD